MTHLHLKPHTVTEIDMKAMLPQTGSVSVAAATVGKNEQAVCMWIVVRSRLRPPGAYGIYRKLGCVTCGPNTHKTFISRKIINPIGDGDTFCIGREIMIKNLSRMLSPSATGLMEKTDFLPAFGIDTDHGHPLSHIVMDLASDITKLKVDREDSSTQTPGS